MGWTAIIVVHFWAGAGDFFLFHDNYTGCGSLTASSVWWSRGCSFEAKVAGV